MTAHQTRLSLWLALLFGAVAAADRTAACRVRFDPVSGCPTDAERAQLRTVGQQSAAACLKLCALDARCTAAALYLSVCHLGAAFAPAWPKIASGESQLCQGFARHPELPSSLGLVCWFSFPYGLANLVTDGGACATRAVCLGAVCNASGATLAGKRGSRVEIPTPGGLQSRVGGQAFTVFVKVKRQRNSQQNAHYFRLMSSANASPVMAFLFETASGKYEIFYSAASSSKFTTTSAPAPAGLTVVSAGMTYSSAGGFGLFLNDQFQTVQSMTTVSTSGTFVDDVIALGHEPSLDAACLAGTLLCFAVANRSLSENEFRLLRDSC